MRENHHVTGRLLRRRRKPPVALLPSTPQLFLPSLDILLQAANQERDKQIAHFDSLDTKAGVLLAFDGILVTILSKVQYGFHVAGIALAAGSACAAFLAFWPRKFPVIEPMVFRQFLTYEPTSTGLKLHDTVASTVQRGGQILRLKSLYLKLALTLLLLAVLTLSAGIVVNTIQANDGKVHHVIQRTRQQAPTPRPSRATNPTAPSPATS